MPQINDINDPINLAERIVKNNKKIIKINKKAIQPLTSIGISIYPNDGETIEELLNKADKQMYKAKKLGNNLIMHNNIISNS